MFSSPTTESMYLKSCTLFPSVLYTVFVLVVPRISLLTSVESSVFIFPTIHVIDVTTSIPTHMFVAIFGFLSELKTSVTPSHPMATHNSALHTTLHSSMKSCTALYFVKSIIPNDFSKAPDDASAIVTITDSTPHPNDLNAFDTRSFCLNRSL